MNLGFASASYISLFLMLIEITLKIVAIYTMLMIAKALRTYIKRNS